MDPVSLILGGASLLGGIMSHAGGRKTIDPAWLKQHFGAQAVTQEFQDLFNTLINSPQGQQMMTSAAEQGQQFANNMSARAAQAGFGPGAGADSGSSIFATSAAESAPQSLMRGVRSDVAQMALPMAHQIVQDRMNAAVQSQLMQQQTPTTGQAIGGAIGNAAGTALLSRDAPVPHSGTTPPPGPQPPSMGQTGFKYQMGGQSSLAPAQPQASTFSRVGKRQSRFGSRFGRFVSPPPPMSMEGTYNG